MQSIISNKREFINLVNACQFQEGKVYNFSFEEVKQTKTLKQLGFIFGALIKQLSLFYFENTGETYTPEIIKEMLYDEVGIDEIIQLPNYKKIVSRKSLSKMSKLEASEFINKVINWIDVNLPDCILPPAIRYCWTLHITDKQIDNVFNSPAAERNEWYLSQLRKSNCLYCGKPICEAHHIKKGWYAKGLKPPDWMAIPLCHECHIGIAHTKGEEYLLRGLKNILNGLDIKIFCRLLYEKTIQHQ